MVGKRSESEGRSLEEGFRRTDWPTVWGSVQVCCGIFSLLF